MASNTTGHPALSLPAGRLPNGLPFGLQVVGRMDDDSHLLDRADAQRKRLGCAWRGG